MNYDQVHWQMTICLVLTLTDLYRLVLCESFVKLLKQLAILIDHLSCKKHPRPELALINDLNVTCFGFIVAKNLLTKHENHSLTRRVYSHTSNSTTVLDLKLIGFLRHHHNQPLLNICFMFAICSVFINAHIKKMLVVTQSAPDT